MLAFPGFRTWLAGDENMFDGESATSQKNVEYFKYSETEEVLLSGASSVMILNIESFTSKYARSIG